MVAAPFVVCLDALADARLRGAAGFMLVAILVGPAAFVGIRAWVTAARRGAELQQALDQAISREPSAGQDVIVVRSDEAFAFTLGLREPRVYISTATVKMLTAGELEAVVLHEQSHAASRDPLRKQALLVLRASLRFVPGAAILIDAYLRSREFEADDNVRRVTGTPDALLSAFFKLATAPTAATGYSDFAAARMRRLLSGEDVSSGTMPLLTALLSSVVFLAAMPVATLLATEWHLLLS
jgi:Zn-dependent protease with chaperone function